MTLFIFLFNKLIANPKTKVIINIKTIDTTGKLIIDKIENGPNIKN